MATRDEQKTKRGGANEASPVVVKSAGEAVARGFVEVDIDEGPVHPTLEMERVQISDPRRSPTLRRIDIAKGTGPRAPDEVVKRGPAGPVEMPLERPATKMQVVKIDRDLLAELSMKAASVDGAPGEVEQDRETQPMTAVAPAAKAEAEPEKGASPWAAEAAVVPIAAGDLPSSHAPVSSPVVEPVAKSEKPAGPRGRTTTVLGVLALVGVLVLLVMAVKDGGPRSKEPVAVPATGMASATAAGSATATATATATDGGGADDGAAPAMSSAGVEPSVPPGASLGSVPPKPKATIDDPYDAAPPPSPPKTSSPSVPTAPTVVPSAAPTAPPAAPSTGTPPIPSQAPSAAAPFLIRKKEP